MRCSQPRSTAAEGRSSSSSRRLLCSAPQVLEGLWLAGSSPRALGGCFQVALQRMGAAGELCGLGQPLALSEPPGKLKGVGPQAVRD